MKKIMVEVQPRNAGTAILVYPLGTDAYNTMRMRMAPHDPDWTGLYLEGVAADAFTWEYVDSTGIQALKVGCSVRFLMSPFTFAALALAGEQVLRNNMAWPSEMYDPTKIEAPPLFDADELVTLVTLAANAEQVDDVRRGVATWTRRMKTATDGLCASTDAAREARLAGDITTAQKHEAAIEGHADMLKRLAGDKPWRV